MIPSRLVLQTYCNMTAFGIVVAVFLIVVDAIGILGNLAVVATISINRRFHVMKYFLLVSLAISDFLLLVLVVPFRVGSKFHEDLVFSTTWCKVNAFLSRALYCSTTLHLIAVSHDRYLAIVKSPLTYNADISKAKIVLVVCFVWLLPFSTAAGPLFGLWEDSSSFNARLNVCDNGWDVQSFDQLTLSINSSICAFAVPFIAIAWFNFKVFITAWRAEQQIMAEQTQVWQQNQPQQNRRKEHKAAKDVVVILGVFLVCYFPAWITVFLRQLLPRESVPAAVIFITSGLLFSKAAWNPIIYAVRKREFREALKKMLRFKPRNKVQNIES